MNGGVWERVSSYFAQCGSWIQQNLVTPNAIHTRLCHMTSKKDTVTCF